MTEMSYRNLVAADAAAYRKLRLKALANDPQAFGSDTDRESAWPIEQFAQRIDPKPHQTTFGAFDARRLIGSLGFLRNTLLKTKHSASLFGLFVDPAYRGRDIAQALLHRAIAKAQAMPGVSQLELAVNVENAAALHLYEAAGFAPWGRRPDALRIGNTSFDEFHMILDVSSSH